MKKTVYLILLFLMSLSVFSQDKNINHYKYIIVPVNFSFLKGTDQYQVSSFTKFLFNKIGFNSYLSNEEFPADLKENKCLALTVDIKDDSNMLKTKEQIKLLDCNNNVVFTSPIGKSKLKDYKRSYHEAIRNAFKSIKSLNYQYQPSKKEAVKTAIVPKVEKPIKAPVKTKKATKVLYAQSIENGFQLVDNTPKIVFKIVKTSKKDVFMILDKNGILSKKGEVWEAEYYKNGQLIKEEYQIKF